MSKITRKKHERNFTTIHNDIPNNPNLSWKAKGLLLYLISRPDDWSVYVSQLTKVGKDGKEATASGLKELINAGYVLREIERGDKGKFKGYNYLVSEFPEYLQELKPVNGLPENGKPVYGEPATTKEGLNKGRIEQRKDTNKNEYSIEFLKFWNQYHEITGKSKAQCPKDPTHKHWKKLTNNQKTKALEKIKTYSNTIKDSKYRVIARTYLADKIFNNEFEATNTKTQPELYIYKVGNATKKHSDRNRWERDKKNFLGNGYQEIKITA